MSGQSGGRLQLSTLNEQLTCKLCGGYFIDATTIIECLHSFCKSCIVKYLENNKFCPVCDAQVHKNKPLLNIRPDQTLQDIVYKLVPGCYQNEMRCRKEFYAKHPEEKNSVTSPEARGEPVESYIYSPDESLSLSLEYYSPEATEDPENDKEAASKHLPRRYLRCPAAVTVFHLQKLIRAKYGLSEAHRVDIMYKEAPLCATYTLMDIMYIYHWRRKVPLHLSYRIFESASKRIKLSEDNDEFKQSLSNSNMEIESKDNEQSIKREWKEVQLKISETGVMSVMDISSLDSKKSTKINEINQQSGLDQAASNSYNVNKTVVKTEEKEAVKSCTASSKSKKVQQDSSAKKSEQAHEEKSSNVSLSAISASQNNSKSEEMEVKSIDQRDLSNELMKADNVKNENSPKAPNDSAQTSSTGDKSQAQKAQQPLEKIKTEPASTADKRSEGKQNLTNNNSINNETKAEANAKPNAKSNDAKGSPSAGSKINALSAKLQFQPKVGQVNNTYSKKSPAGDKKATSTSPVKTTDTKPPKISIKSEAKPSEDFSSTPVTESNTSKVAVTSVACSGVSAASNLTGGSSVAATYVTAPSTSIDTCATSVKLQQQQHNSALQTVAAPSTESLASIGLHVSTTMPSQVNLNSWMAERSKNSSGKTAMSPDLQLRSMPGMPQIGKDIVCSTTASSPASSMGRFNIQTPSMSIYSISSTMKNNVYTSTPQNYSNSPSKQAMTKPGFGTSNMYPQVPPCPAAIPISLMKPAKASKGTTLNEICAKISNASSGSKINDICAKIGESSKEKSKIDAMQQQQLQRNKPEVPDLLKISKKSLMTPVNESIHGSSKHIPNIPNVPIYTPSNSQALHASNEAAKDSVKRLATALVSSQAALMTPQMQKMSQKKHSQAVGYKTLRDPPKSWNPTLSKNNYVAAKNQAKEMQNQAQAAYGINDGSSATSKQPASKQAKIFKIRNMPRYLGNPASGVKPMYGVVNEQSKDKDQSTSTKNNSPTMSMMKIDPQTLSPIVSSPNNSPIVSPPPYSPTARSYQNSPFTPRDICRNSNSPISPRNSPVNMLSTNPFIPSQTHNTNPRLIYSHFPPTFTDASRFSNPLIRSPIGISPPSAYHSSMPPSINKFYRSGYMTQPQTSVAVAAAAAAAAATASFSSGATAQQQQQQPPAVQRIPPSSHSSPVPPASSPSASSPSSASSKSPKTSSASSGGAGATNVKLTTTTTTSTTTASVVDSVALQLAKGLAQRDSKVYDLTRTDSPKSSSDNTGATNQNASTLPQSAQAAKKNSDISNKAKSSPSAEVQKTSDETSTKQNDSDTTSKSTQQEAKTAISTAATATTTAATTTVTKDLDKDEKSHAKVNGSITITMTNNDKSKVDAAGQQKQEKVEKPTEDKISVVDAVTEGDKSNSATSPSKSASSKTVTQEAEKIETKQSVTAPQQKLQNTEGGKTGDATTTPQGKKIVADAQKGKAES